MTDATANLIYDILVRDGGAHPGERSMFVSWSQGSGFEYRFQGHLGLGGKFWRVHDQWYVTYYREDVNPIRQGLTEKLNLQLAALKNLENPKPEWSYDLGDQLRVTELAPFVPPEFLKRTVRHLPLVQEMHHIISFWYIFLAHDVDADIKSKLNPGILDEYLDRMYAVLREVDPHLRKMHGTTPDATTTPDAPAKDLEDPKNGAVTPET